MATKRKLTDPHDALAHIMAGMRQAGASSRPGPVDSFKFGGVVWWRLQTPGGNSMIVGLPDAKPGKMRRPTCRAPSPVVAEVVKEIRAEMAILEKVHPESGAVLGCIMRQRALADRLERGE